jgi:acylphosphatase
MRYPALRGFVKNLPDGRVEAVFLGEVADVLAMVQWCSHGPPAAQVTDLEVKDEANDPSLPTFEIRR